MFTRQILRISTGITMALAALVAIYAVINPPISTKGASPSLTNLEFGKNEILMENDLQAKGDVFLDWLGGPNGRVDEKSSTLMSIGNWYAVNENPMFTTSATDTPVLIVSAKGSFRNSVIFGDNQEYQNVTIAIDATTGELLEYNSKYTDWSQARFADLFPTLVVKPTLDPAQLATPMPQDNSLVPVPPASD